MLFIEENYLYPENTENSTVPCVYAHLIRKPASGMIPLKIVYMMMHYQ